MEADEFVPVPKGDVHKKKDVVQDVTLYDLDMANAKPQGGSSEGLGLLSNLLKPKKTEITEKLRNEINKVTQSLLRYGFVKKSSGRQSIHRSGHSRVGSGSFIH